MKSWKKIIQENISNTNAGVAILISHEIGFKKTKQKRLGEILHTEQRKKNYQADILILNIYATNSKVSEFVK